MKNIKTYARLIRFLSIALVVIIMSIFVRNWLIDIVPGVSSVVVLAPAIRIMSMGQRLIALLVNGLFVGILICALYYCIKLMKQFESGDIFSPTTTGLLQKITGFLFWWAVYAPIHQTLNVLIKTFNNPVGQRILSVCISSNDIFVILICLFLHIITSIMQEACRIKAEQDLII